MVIATAPDRGARLSSAPPFDPTVAGSAQRTRAVTVPSCDARPLIDFLRSPDVQRPAVDPALAGGLRAWLDDGLASPPLDGLQAERPVVLGAPSRSAARQAARHGAEQQGVAVDANRIRLAIARCLFRLALTVGLGPRPFEEAMAALSVDDVGNQVVEAVGRMGREQRSRCRLEGLHHAAMIGRQWRPAAPGWLPRTADSLRAPLAGGAVLLSATADLVLGAPSSGRASICIVQVALDAPAAPAAADRSFVALLETLRSGAPPLRVATYRPDAGRLDVDDVADGMLVSAVRDTLQRLSERVGVCGTNAL